MPSIQLQNTVYDIGQNLVKVVVAFETYNKKIADLERLIAAVEGVLADLKLCEPVSILLLKDPLVGSVDQFKNKTITGVTSGASGKVQSSAETIALGFKVYQLILSGGSGSFLDDDDNRETAQAGSNSGLVLYHGTNDPTDALKRAKAIVANKGTSQENQRAAIQSMQDKIIALSGSTITSTFDTTSVATLLTTVGESNRNSLKTKVNTFITSGS